jgi:hypothetical protein
MSPEQQEALDELMQKTLQQIQCETAIKWAYRAWAAYKMKCHHDAIEYEHEAIEHAALSGDDRMLAVVRSIITFGVEVPVP